MGNKFGSCGCRTETTARGYGYSPYSKQMSRNLVRFWAEVFLLAQEGQSVETKWQMVVPKLVPVNVARVQDSPTVISHVTAYNTKVDKVMDTLIFHPGIEVYRGSECFIYWSDPQKGLTWGLNFVTPDDASYFVDIVSGGSTGLMCRRANSTQSLATKQKGSTKLRSTSSPGTPESGAHGPRKHGGGRTQSVKFVETPTICEASPSSADFPSMAASMPDSGHQFRSPDIAQIASQDPFYGSSRQPNFRQPVLASGSIPSALGGNLNLDSASYNPPTSSGQVIVHLPSCARNRTIVGSGFDDVEKEFGNASFTSPSTMRSTEDGMAAKQREREAVWKRLDSIAAATEALEPMRMSLDSSSLKKMLDPLPHEHGSGVEAVEKRQQALVSQRQASASAIGPGSPRHSPLTRVTRIPPTTARRAILPDQITQSAEPIDAGKYKPCFTSAITDIARRGTDGSSSVSLIANEPGAAAAASEGVCDVILRQNDRQVPVVLTPSLKRSSIHLVTSKSGRLRATTSASIELPDESQESGEKAFGGEDDNSLSSSLDESTTSQPAVSAPAAGAQATTAIATSSSKGPSGIKNRRAGHMSMKQWIAAKDQNILILTNATWQHYWCCIKGYALCFYVVTSTQGDAPCCDVTKGPRRSPVRREGHGVEEIKLSCEPALTIDLLNCLAQAVPEYPRRQHVFCLSTGLGHVYLLQVTSENELDSWIQALHTHAALASIRNQNRDVAARSLRKEIEKMEEKIETVAKLIKLSQLPSVGTVSLHQVGDWENELELLHLQHFMAKAYLAAIKGQEMPSCKKVLAAATASTKNYLSHLSAFTLSAMHAYIFAKSTPKLSSTNATPQHSSPATGSTTSASVARSSEPGPELKSSERGSDGTRKDSVAAIPGGPADAVANQMAQSSSSSSDIYSGFVDASARTTVAASVFKSRASLVQITLPNNQVTVVSVTDMDSVATVLQKACDKAGLRSERCFMLLRRVTAPGESYVPDDMELLQPKIATHQVEIRERLVYHVHLSRTEAPDRIFGLTIRAQKQLARGRLTVFVSNVDENGLAKRAGLLVGDELLVVNGQCVKTLNSQQIERLLQESQSLCLIMRTKRTALPVYLEPVSCDSSQESLRPSCGGAGASGSSGTCGLKGGSSGQKHLGLIDEDEEAENWFSDTCGLLQKQMEHHKVKYRYGHRSALNGHGRQRYSLPVIPTSALFTQLLQRESTSANASPRHLEQRYSLVGNLEKRISSSEPGDMSTGAVTAALRASGKLGPTERLEKVLFELVETDRAYVEGLDSMIRIYLEPLRERRLLPVEPLERLIDASASVARFQRSFLEELQEAAGYEPNVGLSFAAPSHLRSALLRVGGLFLNTAARFRLYSSFCAAYFRMQKILKAEEQNNQLQQFLSNCNVQRQHSATLESYLIKPVQRVLRYPLFLQQMKSLTSQDTPEYLQIQEALTKMEKVAEYINEMQRVYEEYGSVFNQIQTQCQQSRDKLSLDLSDLLMFGEVGWLNAGEESGKKKNNGGNGPVDCICFVFKSAIVLLVMEKGKGKKNKNNHQNSDKPPSFRVIPVSEIEINGSDVGSTDNHYIWILIHLDPVLGTEKVYHFANRRKDIKQQFLRAIRKAGLLLAKDNGIGMSSSVQLRPIPVQSFAHDPLPRKATSGIISQIHEDDGAELSSPDSGFPQIGIIPMSMSSSMGPLTSGDGASSMVIGLRVAGSKDTNGAGGAKMTTHQNYRPTSHNSSQSDPGYGSNSEAQKKDANAVLSPISNGQANGINCNGSHAVR